jgi:hypothetical protein
MKCCAAILGSGDDAHTVETPVLEIFMGKQNRRISFATSPNISQVSVDRGRTPRSLIPILSLTLFQEEFPNVLSWEAFDSNLSYYCC